MSNKKSIKDMLVLQRLFEIVSEKFKHNNSNKSVNKKKKEILKEIVNIEQYIISKTLFKKTTKELVIMRKNHFWTNSSVNSAYDSFWISKYGINSFKRNQFICTYFRCYA